MAEITHLFLDIGGVLLTNGWDHNSRKAARKTFSLEEECEERHRQVFNTYEEGKITLQTYLDFAIFYKKRPFKKEEFEQFIYDQSKPFTEMIELVNRLKKKYQLKCIAVNNEGKEINEWRFKKFNLNKLFDAAISSCYVEMRKPDPELFHLALDLSMATSEKTLYLENTKLYIDMADQLGLSTIFHENYETTRLKLANFGLQ